MKITEHQLRQIVRVELNEAKTIGPEDDLDDLEEAIKDAVPGFDVELKGTKNGFVVRVFDDGMLVGKTTFKFEDELTRREIIRDVKESIDTSST
jgi:hypothetical protein